MVKSDLNPRVSGDTKFLCRHFQARGAVHFEGQFVKPAKPTILLVNTRVAVCGGVVGVECPTSSVVVVFVKRDRVSAPPDVGRQFKRRRILASNGSKEQNDDGSDEHFE
jgi:hypothetical protein